MIKKWKIVGLLGIAFLLAFSGQTSNGFDETELFTILQNPDGIYLQVNSPLNLTIVNNLDIDINSVLLHYCSLEPNFVCHFPCLQVEQNNYSSYSVVFTPEYGIGSVLGYNFEITMENGSIFNIPDSLSYSDTKAIREASDNLFYFTLTIVEFYPSDIPSETSSVVAGFSILITPLLIFPFLIKKRTGR